ncbi:E3 ubiquitin-protein ligase SINA-like 10 [Magnolia sinica]|uniref:E3 ubiquitin-protein ligase SINA-like 10 n=1 Tax=Magnolia sinica TaxID=86752 RepID=UPI0026583303|nr:E3 ubiquitin-protein ligase SINA-like 10 [Magnolia sinica]
MTKFSVEGEGEEGPSSPNKRKRVFDGEDDDKEDGPTISISIDTDVLDCTICMEPLIPPVYQCDNGHIACSSCCTKLKNKCHSCSWPIGYSRCLAIEKVIESIKVTCHNARYGCKERVSYSNKLTHAESCVYMPCACPIPDCAFLGSADQLSFHFGSNHWAASSIRFRYNCPFPVSLDKNGPFIVLHGEDGRLFILNNSTEHLGNAVAVTCIGPNSSMGGFSYDLITRKGGRSLRLQSFTRSIKRRTDASVSSMDFLLVPHDFHSCVEQLKLEVCIWSTRELE